MRWLRARTKAESNLSCRLETPERADMAAHVPMANVSNRNAIQPIVRPRFADLHEATRDLFPNQYSCLSNSMNFTSFDRRSFLDEGYA